MSIKKIIVTVLASSAFLALPLVASAAPAFFNVSGIARGNAAFTFVNMSSTGKKTNNIVKLANGSINPTVNAGIIVVDSAIFKAGIEQSLTVAYPDNAAIYFDTDGYTLLLGKAGSASGICRWSMQVPTDDYIASHAGTGTQYLMYGSCRINMAASQTGKGVLKASQMVPGEAWYWTYVSDGLGGVTNGSPVTTDGKASAPAMNIMLTEQP